ncbi:MAG TPA: glycosyltransferase [Acidobacteriaceae bacterium]|nr:glycosyltransferase [Acidobacteriaceae bacterium]
MPKPGALRAEAFALPSHQEDFGIAVAESLAAGRPVLISHQVNIWPEIDSERVGRMEPDSRERTERLLWR